MVQFWEFSGSFNDYFNVDQRGSSEVENCNESGSKNDDYLFENSKSLNGVPEYARSLKNCNDDYLTYTIIRYTYTYSLHENCN